MARPYQRTDYARLRAEDRRRLLYRMFFVFAASFILVSTPLMEGASPWWMVLLGVVPALTLIPVAYFYAHDTLIERERAKESAIRGGKKVLGMPPQRDCFAKALNECRARGKPMIDRYLVGFELETGRPLWVNDDDMCGHLCVFAKTGMGKTLWVESLMFQQMARGRASGCTFIDAKRDSGTLAHIILMALLTGRIED
ncbi:MAG: hypothetical protein GYA55_06590 [SAR324 cluster bacterium]|uniref:Uncharacterized protein n=1 Tax=SAR324 cluster bacterium TaxID=2024889 RepID=A0A7X9FRI2_9DELT|nr:hypothetical protein [SAR324 cluster bacterium]